MTPIIHNQLWLILMFKFEIFISFWKNIVYLYNNYFIILWDHLNKFQINVIILEFLATL
jgi:hypothetical protein